MGFGIDEIQVVYDSGPCEHFRNVRSELIGYSSQDSNYFAMLFELQLAGQVVSFHDFSGLDEYGFPGCRFVMDYSRNLPLVHRRNREHKASVAHGGRSIGIQPSLGNCGAQNST